MNHTYWVVTRSVGHNKSCRYQKDRPHLNIKQPLFTNDQPQRGLHTDNMNHTYRVVTQPIGHNKSCRYQKDRPRLNINNLSSRMVNLNEASILRVVFQMGSLPTKIICITQVVSADELKDDEEFEEILDDMKGEGGKYGNLVKVVIPRPGPDGEAAPGVGRIFLEYEDMEGSKKARLGLHGRKFDGRQAVAIFYDENKYAKGEYDG